jgi:hypothetical protein
MKLFCHIFSLYFLALSCLPCTDNGYEVVPPRYQTENIRQNDHDHEDHSHCKDLCSPFCTCTCCGITISFQKTFSYIATHRPTILPIVVENFSYQSSNSLQYLQGVFQPPQLG